ncbi:uncharacterized protein LOC135468983 [Liolophura sinensis]|uniref:uncharacterized protein LOC135468983 n=1 Tax=Liolophura sinensis TaxID=3198878 RepID=UPI00315959E5
MTSQLSLVWRRAPKLCRSMLQISRCPLSQTKNTCTRFYHVVPVAKMSKCSRPITSDKAHINTVRLPVVYQQCATLHMFSYVQSPTTLTGRPTEKKGDNSRPGLDSAAQTGWVIRLANENGYLSWCRNTYLATVVGVGMWAEGPSSIAFHATEGALFLGGLNLVLGTVSYLHTIFRVRKAIHMSRIGTGLHTLAALTHLGIWLTVVITYLGYVEAEEEARHPGTTGLEGFDKGIFLESSVRKDPPK